MQKFVIFTDGGSRGNPGSAACGTFIFEQLDGNLVIKDFNSKYLNSVTNNVAEYEGFLLGATTLHKILKTQPNNGAEIEVIFNLDSELLVKQYAGIYKIKDAGLSKIKDKVDKQIADLTVSYSLRVQVNHVPRALNHLADKLVNLILDQHSE